MLVPHGEGRGMELIRFDGMFRGHMAHSYGGTHGTFLWRDTWHIIMEGLKL